MKKITLYIDYVSSDLTSYEIFEWLETTFGEKEQKELCEEIRCGHGFLKQIKTVVRVD